jgi:hypothetical protein
MVTKTISAVIALLLLCASCFGLFQALSQQSAALSKVPELILFAGFGFTAAGWLVAVFRPSHAWKWLLCASVVATIWLNAFAYLATRDQLGLPGVSINEWVRMLLGLVGIAVLLALAVRAQRVSKSSRAAG